MSSLRFDMVFPVWVTEVQSSGRFLTRAANSVSVDVSR